MPTRELGFTDLMTAVYSRLTTYALTLAYSFFNHVPKGTAYPYHVIGRPTGVYNAMYSTRDTEAEDNAFQVDSWVSKTSGKGDKACADMQNNIVQALTSSALSITGYNNIYLNLDYADILLDPENPELLLRHGILRFRIDMAPI